MIEQFQRDQSAFLETNEYQDYAWSLDTLEFELGTDTEKIIFPIIPVGTWSPDTEQFRWAFAVEHFPAQAKEAARVLHRLIENNMFSDESLPEIQQDSFDCSHMELDDLLAVVHHHLRSKIIFKEKNMEPWMFFAVIPTVSSSDLLM